MTPALTQLSDEEALLRDTVREFARAEIAPRVTKMENDACVDREPPGRRLANPVARRARDERDVSLQAAPQLRSSHRLNHSLRRDRPARARCRA